MAGTINFKEVMEARKHAQQAEAEKAQSEAPVAYVDPEATLSVRSFTAEGIAHVTDLLRKMRIEEAVLEDEVDELVNDIEYSRQLDENIKINPDKVFKTKLELCEYFTKVFTSDFLAEHRRDKGLWTWLAMAYFKQFVKTKRGIVQIAANDCWIFHHESNRYARRHFIAAPIYLFNDISVRDENIEGMIFSRPVAEFNKLLDYLTNVAGSVRTPSYLSVAAGLYYDPSADNKYKKGCLSLTTPGNVFQFTRVLQQFRETYDFSDVKDSAVLWGLLPKQFDDYKETSVVKFDNE